MIRSANACRRARSTMIACLPVGLLALACATGDQTGSAGRDGARASIEPAVELLVRDGCATSQQLEPRLVAALAQHGAGVTFRVIDQGALPSTDPRRGYATPTILIGGHDLFGLPEPVPPFPEPS